MSLAVELESVDVTLGDRAVLRGVSLAVEAGGALALLGESGGGKSTLLKLLDRLVEPSAGAVRVLGRAVADWPIAELRRTAVYVGQQPQLLTQGTVADELRLPLRWRGATADDAALRAALDVVHADLPLDRPAAELSGGEQLRLTLARALLLGPRLLLLDEPTGSLDVRLAGQVLAGLRGWAAAHGATLLVVTHRPEDLRVLGGQALVLLGGQAHGPLAADALLGGAGDPAVEDFLAVWRGGQSNGSPA